MRKAAPELSPKHPSANELFKPKAFKGVDRKFNVLNWYMMQERADALYKVEILERQMERELDLAEKAK